MDGARPRRQPALILGLKQRLAPRRQSEPNGAEGEPAAAPAIDDPPRGENARDPMQGGARRAKPHQGLGDRDRPLSGNQELEKADRNVLAALAHAAGSRVFDAKFEDIEADIRDATVHAECSF
ncbi:MAG TPA: hypothetical protein VKU03_15270 [Roseiarcus sp.]|nr:hypothetical protein [Roseiarcus sp.]